MAAQIFCSSCSSEVARNEIFSHMETFHVGPRPFSGFYNITCGHCNFQVCDRSGNTLIEHMFRTKHDSSLLQLDWKQFMESEKRRVANVVSAGIELLAETQRPQQSPSQEKDRSQKQNEFISASFLPPTRPIGKRPRPGSDDRYPAHSTLLTSNPNPEKAPRDGSRVPDFSSSPENIFENTPLFQEPAFPVIGLSAIQELDPLNATFVPRHSSTPMRDLPKINDARSSFTPKADKAALFKTPRTPLKTIKRTSKTCAKTGASPEPGLIESQSENPVPRAGPSNVPINVGTSPNQQSKVVTRDPSTKNSLGHPSVTGLSDSANAIEAARNAATSSQEANGRGSRKSKRNQKPVRYNDLEEDMTDSDLSDGAIVPSPAKPKSRPMKPPSNDSGVRPLKALPSVTSFLSDAGRPDSENVSGVTFNVTESTKNSSTISRSSLSLNQTRTRGNLVAECKYCFRQFFRSRSRKKKDSSLIFHALNHSKLSFVRCGTCHKDMQSMEVFYNHKKLKNCSDEYVSLRTEEKVTQLKNMIKVCFPGMNFDYQLDHNISVLGFKKKVVDRNPRYDQKKRLDVAGPMDCRLCNKNGFRQNYKIFRHILHHFGQKLYKCESCGNSYSTPEIAVAHARCNVFSKSKDCDGSYICIAKQEDSDKIHQLLSDGFPELDLDLDFPHMFSKFGLRIGS